jgi:serine/threonine protein kinase
MPTGIFPRPPLVGQLLMQRYLILEPLESGGFSQTYLAIDTAAPDNLGCVVKLMDAQLNPGLDFDSLQHLFEAEAYALGCLGSALGIAPADRPVPELMAYCRDQTQLYLVQGLIDGQRLDSWMASVQQPRLKDVIAILMEVLAILAQIHQQGIIHCDLKPSNLIRRHQDQKLILIDFGACCFSDRNTLMEPAIERAHRPDRQAYALGTPGYMPEEQAVGRPEFNSDIYALGMMIIQIITGISPEQLTRYPLTREWNWHEHIRKPLLHLELVPILDRMVRINSHDRYETVDEVITAVQALTPQFAVSRLPLFRLQRSHPETKYDPNAPTLCKDMPRPGVPPGQTGMPIAPTLPYKMISS